MSNERLPVIGAGAPSESGKGLRRRDFILLVSAWIGTLGSLLAVAAAGLRGLVPNLLDEPNIRYRVGKPEDYPVGSIAFLDEVRVFLFRRGDSFRAMSGVCTHLGCTVNRDDVAEGGFRCPCHGSVFDDGGRVLEGPAPRPLPSYAVTMARDGRLSVDRARVVSPDRYLVLEEPFDQTDGEPS